MGGALILASLMMAVALFSGLSSMGWHIRQGLQAIARAIQEDERE